MDTRQLAILRNMWTYTIDHKTWSDMKDPPDLYKPQIKTTCSSDYG